MWAPKGVGNGKEPEPRELARVRAGALRRGRHGNERHPHPPHDAHTHARMGRRQPPWLEGGPIVPPLNSGRRQTGGRGQGCQRRRREG